MSIVENDHLDLESVTIKAEFPSTASTKCSNPKYDLVYQRIDKSGYRPRAVTPEPTGPIALVSGIPHWIELAFNGTITCNDVVETFYEIIFTGKGSKLH